MENEINDYLNEELEHFSGTDRDPESLEKIITEILGREND